MFGFVWKSKAHHIRWLRLFLCQCLFINLFDEIEYDETQSEIAILYRQRKTQPVISSVYIVKKKHHVNSRYERWGWLTWKFEAASLLEAHDWGKTVEYVSNDHWLMRIMSVDEFDSDWRANAMSVSFLVIKDSSLYGMHCHHSMSVLIGEWLTAWSVHLCWCCGWMLVLKDWRFRPFEDQQKSYCFILECLFKLEQAWEGILTAT